MSYLVFARKWRPLSFDDVVGQEHVTRTLMRAIEKDRVAHAYVFSGTRGVGKTTTARILARAMNCEKGPTPEPCGTCEPCRNIIAGSSFDVLEIDGASNNSVNDIRELRENIGYSSMGGGYRIYVIDEVHMLTTAAFNALLKTLEEPPRNVIFIFATTEPQKIPDTILSRCQRYDFRRISTESIVGQLEKICTTENIEFDRQGLYLVGRKADGSMRDALSLLDQVYSFCQDKRLDEAEVRSVLGLVGSDVYAAIMNAVVQRDPAPVLKAVEKVLSDGYDLHEFLSGFQDYLRNLLFVRVPGMLEDQRRDLDGHAKSALLEGSNQFAEGDLLRMTEILHKTENDLRWSSFPRFLVETALLKLVYLDRSVDIDRIIATLSGNGQPPRPFEKKNDSPSPSVLKASAPEPAAAPAPRQPLNTAPVEAPAAARPQPSAPVVEEVRVEVEEPKPAAPRVVSMPLPENEEDFRPPAPASGPLDVATMWPRFIEALAQERSNLATFLGLAAVAAGGDGAVDVRFPPQFGFQFNEVTKKGNRETIEKVLRQSFGREVDLHITVEQEKKHDGKDTASEIRPVIPATSLDDEMENEPIIQRIIDTFDGKVL